ncbi:MAG: hypothetical protein ACXVBW_06975, partial [Bdellovibrionota bacterium]
PFPGGCSSLYRVHEDGKVEPFDPPLLRERRFSFDGAIWANPESGDHWLYQSNIGSAPHPVWMKWDKHRNVTDLSAGLPQELHLGKRKFLVSRAVFPGEREMSLFMGVDTSGGGSDVLESDLILTLREDGTAGFDPDIRLPARLLDPTWSTVELAAEDYDGDGRIDLLLLYHDRDFREGIAEILWSTGKGSRLKRNSARLPIPPLAGEETWIARAASGDLFRDNRIHIALYLRPSRADTSRNLIFLRNRGERKFEDVTSLIGLGGERFVGGFFAGADRSHWIQLTYGGLVEAFRFELS